MSQDPVMHVMSLSRQVLRIAEAVVRALLGSRTRPSLPPRASAQMPASSPAPVRTPPAPVRLKVVVGPNATPAATKPAPKASSSKVKKAAKAPANQVAKNTAKSRKPAKAAAPAKAAKSALAPLAADARYADTVWVPRILWALAWADEQKKGPQSAADLARILAGQAGLKVAPNNVARAFRDFATDKRTKGLWKATGKNYEITAAGKQTLSKIASA